SGECIVVVAELAAGVAEVVPRLVERGVETGGLAEFRQRCGVGVMRFLRGLVLLARIAGIVCSLLRLVRLLHVADTVGVGTACLLLRSGLPHGHRRHLHGASAIGEGLRTHGSDQTGGDEGNSETHANLRRRIRRRGYAATGRLRAATARNPAQAST